MLARLFLLFTLVPLVELALLIWLSHETHWTWALLTVLVTGLFGAWLARRQGFRTWRRIQEELAAGRMPSEPLLDGLLILVAGVLLITPGVLTDLAAVFLLLPPTRKLARRWLVNWFQRRFLVRGFGTGFESQEDRSTQPDQIIDVHVLPPDGAPPGGPASKPPP